MSSRSGSHDVLEALGVDPAPGAELAQRCLREAGSASCSRPRYHARHQGTPRRRARRSAFRTIFNLLGPLTNPAGARHHVNGVFAAERCELLARAHGQLGLERALVVHGAGGLDEIAPAGDTWWPSCATARCGRYELAPGRLRPARSRPGRAARRRAGDQRAHRCCAAPAPAAAGAGRNGGADDRRRRAVRGRARRAISRDGRRAARPRRSTAARALAVLERAGGDDRGPRPAPPTP